MRHPFPEARSDARLRPRHPAGARFNDGTDPAGRGRAFAGAGGLPVRVIGMGQLERGDDAAGRLVVRQVSRHLRACASVIECAGEMCELLEAWEGAESVIVVDAIRSGRPPGTVVRIDAGQGPLPVGSSGTTHGFGLAEAVEVARSLGQLPQSLVIYGIEGEAFGLGDDLSPAVEAALGELARVVAAEAAGLAARPFRPPHH